LIATILQGKNRTVSFKKTYFIAGNLVVIIDVYFVKVFFVVII
jgi:hypothetical protein